MHSFLYETILYDECSENVTREYSSAKYQRRNWEGPLDVTALPLRETLPFSEGIQKGSFPFT